ncbi:hypothetical protein IT570_02095 [Candidatus Sumerlaeota bacterium]|nr:hypothetical protein [Candidatus Sumerlaeota bacterium]
MLRGHPAAGGATLPATSCGFAHYLENFSFFTVKFFAGFANLFQSLSRGLKGMIALFIKLSPNSFHFSFFGSLQFLN